MDLVKEKKGEGDSEQRIKECFPLEETHTMCSCLLNVTFTFSLGDIPGRPRLTLK